MHFVRCAATLAAIFVATHVSAQPQDLLKLQRLLTAVEIDTVVGGIRQALAGRTLRLVQIVQKRGADSEILMGQAGMPHVIRLAYECIAVVNGECVASRVPPLSVPEQPERFVALIEHTGVLGRRCNGTLATGEMVIDYMQNLTTRKWTVTARERLSGEIAIARPLEMLKTAASLRSGENRFLGGRPVRAIVSTSSPREGVSITGDPAPNAADFVPVESLWVDTDTLLPVRWEVAQRQAIVAATDFVYETLDLRPPAGVETPRCIP